MYIPDPVERMENRAERWYDEFIEGDEFICGCSKRCKIVDGETISSNPYAIPVCPDCCKKLIKDEKKKKGITAKIKNWWNSDNCGWSISGW